MKKYELAVPATIEAQELRELERRTDARLDRVKAAERRAAILEDRLRQEREAHRREIDGLATFVTVVTLIVACGVCVLAAPIWTVIFPAAGCLAVMRKAGWL